MKNLLFMMLLGITLQNGYAQYNNLYVTDPQSWGSSKGTIETALVSMTPHGLFMEYGLFLTFSAKNTAFEGNWNDTLEVVLEFGLPDGAILTDSWLWIGEAISKAVLLDKWEASTIYEEIVDRRQDPSILTKVNGNQYKLRVFPMAGNETRKVKITYIVPMDIQRDQMSSNIPVNILKTSKVPLPSVDLLVMDAGQAGNPYFLNFDNHTFQELYNAEQGKYYYAQIPLMDNIRVGFESPVKNGYFFGNYGNDDQNGTYQLAVFPDQFIDDEQNNKIAFLVDNDISNSYFNKDELFGSLELQLKQNLTEADSFNLFVSSFQISAFSEDWLPGTDENITQACLFGRQYLAEYSNLIPLLLEGVEFINFHQGEAAIVLMANSDNYVDYNLANELMNDILDELEQETPVHILDFQQKNLTTSYVGSKVYYGNEYFYINLSHLTHGSYNRMWNEPQNFTFYDLLGKGLNEFNGMIDHFELTTSMTNGFTFAKFNLQVAENINIREPFIQIGKYYGDFPFEIEMNGFVNDDFFNKTIYISKDSTEELDSTQNQVWGGLNIQNLENLNPQTNSTIINIIEKSIKNNVLSLYTAFLCLEDSSQYCFECLDETELVETEDPNVLDTFFKVSPNPFEDRVNIKIAGLIDFDPLQISLEIFNVHGQLIKKFDPNLIIKDDVVEVEWDATDNGFDSGIFYVVFRSRNILLTQKLVRMKF